MPFGTYAADRLRIACIAFCIEEMTGNEVTGGHVEYIPDGISRFHTVQPREPRQVIATLHKIREIRNGELPRRPLNAPCNRSNTRSGVIAVVEGVCRNCCEVWMYDAVIVTLHPYDTTNVAVPDGAPLRRIGN